MKKIKFLGIPMKCKICGCVWDMGAGKECPATKFSEKHKN